MNLSILQIVTLMCLLNKMAIYRHSNSLIIVTFSQHLRYLEGITIPSKIILKNLNAQLKFIAFKLHLILQHQVQWYYLEAQSKLPNLTLVVSNYNTYLHLLLSFIHISILINLDKTIYKCFSTQLSFIRCILAQLIYVRVLFEFIVCKHTMNFQTDKQTIRHRITSFCQWKLKVDTRKRESSGPKYQYSTTPLQIYGLNQNPK